MDLDRFIALNQPAWLRLEELAARARRHPRRLSAAELDEMVALYQRTSAHLAHARTSFDDLALVTRLSRVVGAARGTIYRTRTRPVTAVTTFFGATFPAAVWACRRAMVVSALLLLGPALAVGIWLSNDDDVRRTAIPEELQESYATNDFEAYYSSEAASSFQTRVTVNNVMVSVLAFSSGILLGAPTAWVMIQNGVSLGTAAAVMHANDRGALFWGLILPHGLLELTAAIVAGGAGLMLGWAVIAPGDRTRAAAVAEEGTRTVTIVMGLAVCFVIAGFTEAWVTPSGLPTWARVAIGVTLLALFLAYVCGIGRNAVAQGIEGHLRSGARADRST